VNVGIDGAKGNEYSLLAGMSRGTTGGGVSLLVVGGGVKTRPWSSAGVYDRFWMRCRRAVPFTTNQKYVLTNEIN